jgi:hypothetical protein
MSIEQQMAKNFPSRVKATSRKFGNTNEVSVKIIVFRMCHRAAW